MVIRAVEGLDRRDDLSKGYEASLNGRFWHWERTYCICDLETKKVHVVSLNLFQRLIMPFDFIKITYFNWKLSLNHSLLLTSGDNSDQLAIRQGCPSQVFEMEVIENDSLVDEQTAFEKVLKNHPGLIDYKVTLDDFKKAELVIQNISKRERFLLVNINNLLENGASKNFRTWFRALENYLLYRKKISFWYEPFSIREHCLCFDLSMKPIAQAFIEKVDISLDGLAESFSCRDFEQAIKHFVYPDLEREGGLPECWSLDENGEIVKSRFSKAQIEILKEVHSMIHGKLYVDGEKMLTEEEERTIREKLNSLKIES